MWNGSLQHPSIVMLTDPVDCRVPIWDSEQPSGIEPVSKLDNLEEASAH
jgi:hypothetical protein